MSSLSVQNTLHNSQQGISYNRDTCTKNENCYSLFCLSPDNEFLVGMTCFILEKIWVVLCLVGKNCGIKQKNPKLQPTKTFVRSEVSNYQYYSKNCLGNKSRYIPSIIIIFHCYPRITLLLFFLYQMTKDCDFSSITKCCIHFSVSFVLSERVSFCKNHAI